MRLFAMFAAAASAAGPYFLSDDLADRRYDGHGGLSAGASSRLLFDYPEPTRSEILDILYKPLFGANLHMCKIEIGGDVQSTNGVEASHMHTRDDLNLQRGYEMWLAAEAKKRNPDIATYALSWGTPGWIGNGSYFSDDNIAYQTKFLQGARDVYNVTIDYMGIWNERPWGNTEYVLNLRRAFDAAGFADTKIVGSDGWIPGDQLAALLNNASFSEAEPILGAHYPCKNDQPAEFWELTPRKTYWANEDFSTLGGDWDAAGCWGRSLVQNYVRLNATSTISWSTIWSVYDSYRYFGNGLMYAFEPWSGNFTAPPAVWTSAHVTQFAVPGWRFLNGSGAGLLPGGGSYAAMVPPPAPAVSVHGSAPRQVLAATAADFTIVLEKLEGNCLRCTVPATTAETINFMLGGNLAGTTTLFAWLSNASHHFIALPSVPVINGTFSVFLPRDTMLTLTTTTGQAKGALATPPPFQPFPFPYADNYDARALFKPALYHADNGGAFEIMADPANVTSNQVLMQMSPLYPAGTEWAGNYDPITSLGHTDWANYAVSVDATVPNPGPQPSTDPIAHGTYVGVCVRQLDQYDSGYCLLVGLNLIVAGGAVQAGPGWVLQAGSVTLSRTAGTVLASSVLPATFNLAHSHRLALAVHGSTLTPSLDGAVLAVFANATLASVPPTGLASLRSGFHVATFDNLSIDGPFLPPKPAGLFNKFLLWPSIPEPGGPQDKISPRNDFTGLVGCSVTIGATALTAKGMGRFAASNRATANHTLSIYDAATSGLVASVDVNLAEANGGDLNGYVWATFSNPVTLLPGATYFLVSSEEARGDYFYDGRVLLQAQPGLLSGFPMPVYNDKGTWYTNGQLASPYFSLKTRLTGQCLDRASYSDAPLTRIDTWDCVDDHHNEMFRLDNTTGLLYVRSASMSDDLCVSMGPCGATTSACEMTCNPSLANQTFTYSPLDGTLRLLTNAAVCVTASNSEPEDAPISLTACAAPPKPAQQWDFESIAPASSTSDWGQTFGPINVLL